MTNRELHLKQWDNWVRIPDETRAMLRDHLRARCDEVLFHDVRVLSTANPDGWMVPHHHFDGMKIRNILREVVRDDALPGVEYQGGTIAHNWDDFYVAAVEDAAGVARPR